MYNDKDEIFQPSTLSEYICEFPPCLKYDNLGRSPIHECEKVQTCCLYTKYPKQSKSYAYNKKLAHEKKDSKRILYADVFAECYYFE